MPQTSNIRLLIDDQQADINSVDDFPVTISYKLEDPDNFQVKTSAEALSVQLPATLTNDRLLNTFHNAGIEDLTSGEAFKTFRKCVVEEGGVEVLVGRALLTSATHTDRPEQYEMNIYGNNADWIIALKDTTLYDFLKGISFGYSTANIMASWSFDGRSAELPYVFAPVRYMLPFDNIAFDPLDNTDQRNAHYNTDPSYLCPSLSVYWILFNAFKSIGYRIQSDFMDTDYFRRMVMPWTFGAFPSSNGTKQDIHKFVAMTKNVNDAGNYLYESGSQDKWLPANVLVDPSLVGTFDNNAIANGPAFADYSYIENNQEMRWTYQNNADFGKQRVGLSLELNYSGHATGNSDGNVAVYWYKNGVPVVNEITGSSFDYLVQVDAAYITIGGGAFAGDNTAFFSTTVSKGDYISARLLAHMFDSKLGSVELKYRVVSFKFEYFKTPLDNSALINFSDYTFFKQYKFTDFFKGLIDLFNLQPQADPVNKVLYIEPMHAYSLVHSQANKTGGYMNGNYLDWNFKQDLSQASKLQLYSDANREFVFRFRDDASDGCLKVVADRIQTNYQYKQDTITNSLNAWAITKSMLGAGKYVLPDRFNKDVTEMENSFFSPCMHYVETNWKGITGKAPQLICIIPENISNTSASEAANTFQPKIAWYKGEVSGVGGWRFNGTNRTTIPFLFSVNYNAGGENDPILSYCDELIGSAHAVGLTRRFFLQRMAIMRNGQYYTTSFRLNNEDVGNILHREHIIATGQRWELVEIQNYRPSNDQSTQCSLRKWSPITADDFNAVYPSANSVSGTPNTTDIFETKYQPLMCLASDIPQQ
ncbi:hypothetical protein [Deminuibacter soli]|uniref:Uncharacterized protein n=1 Tax=Deminuibacter soli TaxID=2291815 RepID=A0A3E1NQ42_9BACT|nr:hypothetical protein [Deminuibacter soli]RFM30030.1 hypothetical protein DXN05_03400 [Deminuibacter soli]